MSTIFNLEVDEIVRQAYLRLGGEPTTGQNARDARTALNLLFTDFLNRGAPLAKVELKSLPLISGTDTYTLDQEDVDVLDLVIRFPTDTDYGMNRMSLAEYNHMPRKDQTGKPSQYVIKTNKDDFTLTVWPVPDQDDYSIEYYTITRIDDINTARDTPDVNFRYLPAVISGLAWYLSFYDADFSDVKQDKLERRFEQDLERARIEDMERVPTVVTPFAYSGQR
jgi:hypothetical protein